MPDADSQDSPGGVNLETHPLVAKLHANPDELSDLVALVGYLGPSKKTDHVRLYVDLTFRSYYEIPTEGILSTSAAAAADENSPTTVHVAGSTQLEKVSVTIQSTEARFLQGSIAGGYLSGADVGVDAQCSWPTSPSCWCRTAQNCQQGAAQVGQPYTDTFYHTCGCSFGSYTCNNCGQAGPQANAQAWPPSPTCWGCNTKLQGCQQAGAQPGQAFWPASPTCWCNITRNCAPQGAQAYTDTLFHTCACTYENCGQAGGKAGGGAAQYWPGSPTCWWCHNTSQGCS